MGLGLYIHIPFSKIESYYSDFVAYTNRYNKIEEYIDSLILELSMYKNIINRYKIKTIFIGGGSPSTIDPKYISKIINYIKNNFNVDDLEEFTIEVDPKSLSLEKAKIYKDIGINRISLKLETMNNNILKFIGKNYKIEDFYKSYNILGKLGFNNINVDLLFGIPGQKIEDIVYDLNNLIDLDIKHISYYGFIIEDNTKMDKDLEEGNLELPSDKYEREMYYKAIEILNRNQFNHYEISHFAKKGYESKHSKIYWKIKPYLGLGLSSHSNINNKRFWNTNNLDKYINKLNNNKLAISGEEIINKEMEIAEYCIFGIRLTKGINKNEFKNRFSKDIYSVYGNIIKKHIKNGLLEDKFNYIKLSKKGMDFANLVEMDFLP